MKNKMINTVTVMGWVYDHDLQLKTTGENSKHPGTEYITGTLKIATDGDKECLNVVPVHFSYVTELTSKGTSNNTFIVLKKIIDKQCPTVMADGKENASKISVDGSIELNEWIDNEDKLISAKRIAGSFIHLNPEKWENEEQKRSMFTEDILINNFTRLEANEEKKLPERGIIKGAIFNFKKELLPVEFTVTKPSAIDYFENYDISSKNPLFTRVCGNVVSQTIVRVYTEESAFGEPMVRETRTSYKDYVVFWAAATPYEFDTPETILASELGELIQQREIRKAELKKSRDAYKSSSVNQIAANNKGYNF